MGTRQRVALATVAVLATAALSPHRVALAQTTLAATTARASLAALRAAMDEFHTRIPVYDDVSSAGNHFHTFAGIPDGNAPVAVNGSWPSGRSGATAIRFTFTPASAAAFGGYYFQNGVLPDGRNAPEPNFGTIPNAGVDLSGATTLTFWARGERGGERIEFFLAGVGRDPVTGAPIAPFPDSSPRHPRLGMVSTLTPQWQFFRIPLDGLDLSYVLGGFGWVASAENNPQGAVFYVDDIQYELGAARLEQRLNEPRFIRSYATRPIQPDLTDGNTNDDDDLALRNAAFVYDNALALLAFLADGSVDALRRARLIGDAIVYAVRNDRYFQDNRGCGTAAAPDNVNGARLRTAYSAGDIALPPGWMAGGRARTVAIPGYYLENPRRFVEVQQAAIDTGNNAWAIIALTALSERGGEFHVYLDVACALGRFVAGFQATQGTYQGFLGGTDAPEAASPTARPYASTEHNLDIIAAFTRLARLTGSAEWTRLAQHARTFVEAMWDTQRGCFLAGTTDRSTRNTTAGQLPLDVQAWSVLALPSVLTSYARVVTCAETYHLTSHDGFGGFDFNDDRDGVWFEGTAQMGVAYALAGRAALADLVRQELRKAQQRPPFGDGEAIVAASHDNVSTGFGFGYFRRLHLGATAWNVFAQLGFNPFADFAGRLAAAPAALAASVNGSTVSLSWTRVPGAMSYVVEAGTDVGRADIFNGDVGATPAIAATVAPGAYYVRVRTRQALGISEPSPEALITVGNCVVPPPPAAFRYVLSGTTVNLSWDPSPGATSYVLSAGTLRASADVFAGNIGSAAVLSTAAAPNTYYVRLRAAGPCGSSLPTRDSMIVVR